jgi:hypothetical protein
MFKSNTVLFFAAAATTAVLIPMSARAVELMSSGLTSIEALGTVDSFRLRKLFVENQGLKTGVFTWNASENAYVLNGELQSDDNYFGTIQLWKLFWTLADPQSEKISVFAGGIGVQSVSFKSPKGIVYTGCGSDGSAFGFNMFNCEIGDLPVGQTDFGNGKYILTYHLQSGKNVTRSVFLSVAYPAKLIINYPTNGTSNVSVTPTVEWTAIGATGYDFIIRDAAQNSVYGTGIYNSIDSSLSHTVPAGALLPNMQYYLTIEANGPVVNGGTKGFKKVVAFTTAP